MSAIRSWRGLRAGVHASSVERMPSEPLVTVIVVAHNEAQRIERRIENLLSLDYPREKLEIVIASDGSTDETVSRANVSKLPACVCERSTTGAGKAAVLNDVVPSARGEIVVLADARQRFDAGTLRALVADFGDPRVGAVSGELVIRSRANDTGSTIAAGASFYWRYEKFIRRNESRANSTVGATGAVYAIRRELFERIPDDTLLDDVLIPMKIISRGYRVLFEPGARAYDLAAASPRQEFVRKVRTIAGTFQLFARERWLFNPAPQQRVVRDALAQGAATSDAVAARRDPGRERRPRVDTGVSLAPRGAGRLLCGGRDGTPARAAPGRAADAGAVHDVPARVGDGRRVCVFRDAPAAGDVGARHGADGVATIRGQGLEAWDSGV